LRTHSAAEIDWHFQSAQQLKHAGVAITVEHERDIYRLTLLTRDRPALFASVAGAISSFGLDILKAEAFSNSQGVVLDTFSFGDPYHTLELNPSELERLREVVGEVAEGKKAVEHLLRGRTKVRRSQATRVRPSVHFNHLASETATLIEIVAEDRPGLLHDLARTMTASGCSVDLVLVDTEAHKALDVFYVTRGGHKLDAEVEIRLKNELMAVCLPS
jgi:[protein-PII] uridylyltransferase